MITAAWPASELLAGDRATKDERRWLKPDKSKDKPNNLEDLRKIGNYIDEFWGSNPRGMWKA